MELRSRKKSKDALEYAELKITLTGLGVYEQDMQLTEMREIVQALQISETDVGRDFQETELAFTDVDNLVNSTMINATSQHQRSPSSSPEPYFEILTVQALVHHPLGWSPPRNQIDRDNDGGDGVYGPSSFTRTCSTLDSSLRASKSLCLDSIENAPDSGISLSNDTFSNASLISVDPPNCDDESFDMAKQLSSEFCSTRVEETSAFIPNTSIVIVSDESV